MADKRIKGYAVDPKTHAIFVVTRGNALGLHVTEFYPVMQDFIDQENDPEQIASEYGYYLEELAQQEWQNQYADHDCGDDCDHEDEVDEYVERRVEELAQDWSENHFGQWGEGYYPNQQIGFVFDPYDLAGLQVPCGLIPTMPLGTDLEPLEDLEDFYKDLETVTFDIGNVFTIHRGKVEYVNQAKNLVWYPVFENMDEDDAVAWDEHAPPAPGERHKAVTAAELQNASRCPKA